jgi:hypothetical protein
MSEIITPGAPTGIPAGYATQSLAGGFPTLKLSDHVAAADVLELTGTLTAQDITVLIPKPLFPTQTAGTTSYGTPTATGWMKIVKNSTSGSFSVVLKCVGGSNTVVIPQGPAMWVYSPDGAQLFVVTTSPSNPIALSQTDWYVDWVSGNDANSGSITHPVKTVMGGIVAKWGTTSPVLNQNTTLHIVSAQPFGAEEIVLAPYCNGFAFNIVQVPPVAGDPQLLGSGIVLAGLIAKNRTTAQRLTVTLDRNYPAGSIVQNLTSPSSAVIESMVGAVATLCQPLDFGSFSEVDTWANGNVVNVIAPSLLNLQHVVLNNSGFTNGISFMSGIRVPDPSGTPGFSWIDIGGYLLVLTECAIEGNLSVPADAQGVFLWDCWNDPSTTQSIRGVAAFYGGTYPFVECLPINNGNFPFCVFDLDAYVGAVRGQFWFALTYLSGLALVADGETMFSRVNVAGAAIWGPGQIGVERGGRLLNHSSLSWVALILLTHPNPIVLDGSSTANNANPVTGVISPASFVSPANLDANGTYVNLTTGSLVGIF